MAVMILCLLDIHRARIDGMTGPQIVAENGGKPSQPVRPAWGVQPGSHQLAGEALRIKTVVQGYGVLQGEKGPARFGAQPSPNFWDR